MSIAHTTRFTRHAWAFPPVPGLPSGVWSASNDDEGDASGGIISFQHIFRNTSNNLGDTNLYNIEQVVCGTQNTFLTAARLTINGMDPGTGQVSSPRPVDRIFQYPLDDVVTGSGFQRAIPADKGTVPLWVGTYSGVDTDLGDMIFALGNPGGGSRVIFAVYGYFWAPGAVNAPQGIRRPEGSIWGN